MVRMTKGKKNNKTIYMLTLRVHHWNAVSSSPKKTSKILQGGQGKESTCLQKKKFLNLQPVEKYCSPISFPDIIFICQSMVFLSLVAQFCIYKCLKIQWLTHKIIQIHDALPLLISVRTTRILKFQSNYLQSCTKTKHSLNELECWE